MPLTEDQAQRLRALIQSFMVAGISRSDLLDQVTSLSSEIYETRPGTRAKHKQQEVFKALENWIEQTHTEDGKRPSQNKMVQFLIKRFQYKESRATELARIFRLYYLKGVAQLTKADHSFLKNTFGREWREFQARSKAVDEAFAAQREAQALLQLMNKVPALLQLADQASRLLSSKVRHTPKA